MSDNRFQCKALKSALLITVISRLVSKSFNIMGSESLGIEAQTDPESPYYGRIPIPPLLDAQIDRIWMDKMVTLKECALSDLNRMIFDKKRQENWYMVFLTTLILLYNIETVYQHQCIQKKRYQDNVSSV